MTHRKAIECFRDLKQDECWDYGAGVNEAFLITIYSRPVAVGSLDASTLTEMIGPPPAE